MISYYTFFYPLTAHFTRFINFGGVPCIRMQVLKILPLIHTISAVNRITPKSPTIGCQTGIFTGVAILTVINIGVNGGINDIAVENAPKGAFNIGNITNMGSKTGNIAGNCNDCASFELSQAEPSAAINEPTIIIFSRRKVKNQGSKSYGIDSENPICVAAIAPPII